jgi:hypothetical protein
MRGTRESNRTKGTAVTIPTSPGGYLAPADVADLLKIGVRAACNLMRKAGGFQLAGSWRIRADVLEARLALQTADAASRAAAGKALRSARPAVPAALLALPETATKPMRHPQPRRRNAAPKGAAR